MKKVFHFDTFIKQWWSGNAAPLPYDLEEWIKNSYVSPEDFWEELFSQQEQLLPPSQSQLGETYDFYHDCITRHLKKNPCAISFYNGDKYPDVWSYERIHTCVNYHVEEWAHDQLKSGELIAIVGEPGIHLTLALFTSLRFGLKICFLPTNSPLLGKGRIIQFLSELKPHYIVTQDPDFLINGIQRLPINEKKTDEQTHAPFSFSYSASSDLQITVSLLEQEELKLVPLSAHQAYLNALRDALLTFNLVQHTHWAAPLACPFRTEPCSTFTHFLSGATRLHVTEGALQKNPSLLEDERIHLLGLNERLQKLWERSGGLPARYLKWCYKDIDNPKGFNQLPQFNVCMDNSSGGAILFSKPSADPYNVYVQPTLGTPWTLSDYNGSGQESLTGFGIFELTAQTSKGNLTATQFGHQLMLTGVVQPSRSGLKFPIDQVEQSISELPFVEDCMLQAIPKAGTPFTQNFILLVFVNPLTDDIQQTAWTAEIERQITGDLGSGYLPDRIEYFALIPRRNLLGIDRNWCANQYRSGLLFKKKDLTHYKLIGALKKLAQEFAKES
ncbi:MAG: hypothetical protein LW832_07860 [Parachlamydia sp.]|jgi:hypothetical protein|nr:hypothetical protein [Parachlamydia sp.]